MTNREKLLTKISAMSDDELGAYLDGSIGEDISLLICSQCQKHHNGDCPMESLGLDSCPKSISDWLKEEAY